MAQDGRQRTDVIRRRSLPRLRNRASLGRLQVFGGVLDFDSGRPAAAAGTAADSMPIPDMPFLSHLCSNLAGPVSSQPAGDSTTAAQSHNKQHPAARMEEEQHEESTMHTPAKNTNNMSKLNALNVLNQRARYPAGLSNGLGLLDSRLDSDHHHFQCQVQEDADEQDHQLHHRQHDGIGHSHSPSGSTTRRVSPASNLEFGLGMVNVDRKAAAIRNKHTEKVEEEDKVRLVKELKQDMDGGGYASLEQILARNGFKVCRVATPPSADRVVSNKHVSPIETNDTASSSVNLDYTASSSGQAGMISGDNSSNTIIHPLSRLVSRSSNQSSSIAASNDTAMMAEQLPNETVKTKTSVLSFSGFVSSLWPSTTRQQSSSSSSSLPTKYEIPVKNPPTPLESPSPTTAPSTNEEALNTSINTSGAADPTIDRNEEIKGWLRQTFDASNAYMNEARMTIEAARLAMGSPEGDTILCDSKQKKKQLLSKSDPTQEVENGAEYIKGSITASSPSLPLTGDTDVGEDDLPLLSKERGQATASTLESISLETPTCPSTTVAHHIPHQPGISCTSSISNSTKMGDKSPIKLAIPLYSPPLRQAIQIKPIIDHQVTYFDSPLVRKKMKRISMQIRQEHRDSGHSQGLQREMENVTTTEMDYPPCQSIPSGNCGRASLDGKLSDGEEMKATPSAESLLRGTLRHALSASTLGGMATCSDLSDPATKAQLEMAGEMKSDNKVHYRPSITTIFDIPMGITSSGSVPNNPSADAGSSDSLSNDVSARKQERAEQALHHLTESSIITESLAAEVVSSSSVSSTTASTTGQSHTFRSTSTKDTSLIRSASASSTSPPAPPPKLLRKTASRHTLRKAASPILSNAIAVHRDEDILKPSPTPVKDKTVMNAESSYSNTTERLGNNSTPVNGENASPLRGPVPLRSPSPPSAAFKSNDINSTNGITDPVEREKSATIRQMAHRDLRDSPIGGTRRPPLAISRRIGSSNASSSSMTTAPGTMDDENDDSCVWGTPKHTARGRTPLGAIMKSHNNNNAAITTTSSSDKVRPRLKAKESLERLLAYKQSKEEDKENKQDNVPPVPVLSNAHIQSVPSKQQVPEDAIITGNITPPLVPSSSRRDSMDEGQRKPNTFGRTITRKTSFGGTIRGLVTSAVAVWTESTFSSGNERGLPISTTQSTSVTSLPSRQQSLATMKDIQSSQKTLEGHHSDVTSDRKSVRRAKSMYIQGRNRKRIGERDRHNSETKTWITMERDRGNSLILPTIIISDYTHD